MPYIRPKDFWLVPFSLTGIVLTLKNFIILGITMLLISAIYYLSYTWQKTRDPSYCAGMYDFARLFRFFAQSI